MLLEDLSLKTRSSDVNFLSSLSSGVFAAAYDEKIEWVVVKGVARFVNQTHLLRSEWMSFASTMAASVVAKMLNDPVVFQEWPHCNQGKLAVKCSCILNKLIISMKKFFHSEWLREMQFSVNTMQNRGKSVQKEVTNQAF